MLAQFRKWVLVNDSGQLLTYNAGGRINIKETAWFITPATGLISYAQLADDDLGFIAGSSLADGAEIVGDVEIDNTSNLYIGSQVQIEITHDEGSLADGTFGLWLAEGDAAGELQTDASGYDSAASNLRLVGSITWHSAALDDEVIRSRAWEV